MHKDRCVVCVGEKAPNITREFVGLCQCSLRRLRPCPSSGRFLFDSGIVSSRRGTGHCVVYSGRRCPTTPASSSACAGAHTDASGPVPPVAASSTPAYMNDSGNLEPSLGPLCH